VTLQSLLRVVTSAEAAARDASAITAGIPSRALMQRAGAAVAGEIALRFARELERGALVYAGPGNNGGDGWVVARALAESGVNVRVAEPIEARTEDAQAERGLASHVQREQGAAAYRGEGVVVDALLGTGATGAPRGSIASAVAEINGSRDHGARVVALDVPTGLDASTGVAQRAVRADLTVTFGTIKRGHLVAREVCGTILVVDIGLGGHAALDDGAPAIVDERWVASLIPRISADAHKGVRRKLAIVGGAEGMAGAAVLSARAAMRSGIGMVKLVVAPASLGAVQQAEPIALAGVWPNEEASASDIAKWADAIVIGPGLGRSSEARAAIDGVMRAHPGPFVLDADALNHFAGDLPALASLVGEKMVILTPHPAELARLAGVSVSDVLSRRFEIGGEVAAKTGACVLLKGVPTVVTSRDGLRLVSASGSPVLAAAGSGDILSGIAGTLAAQIDTAHEAAAAAAWVHGRAAEIAATLCNASEEVGDPDLDESLDDLPVSADASTMPNVGHGSRRVRGITLDDVLGALRDLWLLRDAPSRYPVLLELPAVGEP
jgi:ADP-dependent NAD(P)H-hydrate dehydratase / NAD(P)H-hydrate epimerase